MELLKKSTKYLYIGIDFVLEKVFIVFAMSVLIIVKSGELIVNTIRFEIISRIIKQFRKHGVFKEMEYIP